ncbi:MAG: lytic transglycosylase domain-containing protein [Candidatus Gastranaerophilales bacterium]|nr:lytic transglycosylase domain-containing protein [Candidatus Gastranaerophilales bacterium]MCM1072369.1 lytic transglycosylase domain-containing protein [Bacteroides sp.]
MIKKIVVTAIALVSFLGGSVQAAIPEDVVKETIIKHSMEMGVDPALALSIAKKESGFKHELRSPHGAVGVFQLLPSTASRIGFNPYYLSENVKAGLTYYKMMYKMFGSTELALAAYNAGPGNVKKYGGQIPPYSETKRFVNVIMQDYNKLKANPDPAIAKYTKKTEAIEKPTNISNTQKQHDLPDLKEIPEIRQSDPVMEIL